MRVKLPPFLVARLAAHWPADKIFWQKQISRILGLPARLPLFFWEVEAPLKNQLAPRGLTVDCSALNQWLPVVFEQNARRQVQAMLTRQLLRESAEKKAG